MGLEVFSLEGKIAVVTGGRRGIGKAIAIGFAECGADVAVCDLVIEDGELEAVAEEIRKLGRRSLAVQADVTKKAQVDNMLDRVEKELGPIDILVNNAGIGSQPPLMETPEEEWHKIIDADLTSVYLCSQAAAKRMMERKSGNIISISSGSGLRGWDRRNTYNVAKAGVIMVTKVLARDLGRYNIRVNAIAPTRVISPMTQRLAENPKATAAEAARIPLGRIGELSDVVGPAIFLASDASSYVSGDTIIIDGAQMT